MERTLLYSCLIVIAVTILCTGTLAKERRRYRTRARHILTPRFNMRRYLGYRQRGHRSSVSTLPSMLQTGISSTQYSPTSGHQHTQTDYASPSRTSNPRNSHISTRRRGSQNPEELIGSENHNDRETDTNISIELNSNTPSPDTQRGQMSENSNHQDQRPDQSEIQGRPNQQSRSTTGSPFFNKMSAFDYLSRDSNSNIYNQNANTRRNREHGRIMGEVMCEAFGKHYVSISIGGRCV